MGLNAHSLADYLRMFRSRGMTVIILEVNASKQPIFRLFSMLRRIPFLEEYFSHNPNCIQQK